jgi:curved DNA-binding protein CbpA
VPSLDPIPEFDLYAELKVPPFADADAIERAWRAGVRSVHPDRAVTGDERAATTRTARLNIAREWLMDPTKRARYDLLRRPGPRIEIPTIDPLGSWPARPRRRPGRSSRARFLMQGLPAFVSIGLVAFLVGLGTANVIAMMAFGLALFLLYSVTWVLIGGGYRGRDN